MGEINTNEMCGIFDGDNPEPGTPRKCWIEAEDRLIFNSWTCRFCGATYADHDLALNHALECDENEDVHSCATCSSYDVAEEKYGHGYRHICRGNAERIDTWMKHCPEWIGK